MSISIHYILIWCFQKCIFSRGEECKCRKKSSHNVHLLVLVHNISRLYVEVGDHNLVLAPTSILAVIYSSELEKVSLSGVVVFLIRHHHVTFKSSELERYVMSAIAMDYNSIYSEMKGTVQQFGLSLADNCLPLGGRGGGADILKVSEHLGTVVQNFTYMI